jgi:hypothetical protein
MNNVTIKDRKGGPSMSNVTIGNRTKKGFETISRPNEKLSCEPLLKVLVAGKPGIKEGK